MTMEWPLFRSVLPQLSPEVNLFKVSILVCSYVSYTIFQKLKDYAHIGVRDVYFSCAISFGCIPFWVKDFVMSQMSLYIMFWAAWIDRHAFLDNHYCGYQYLNLSTYIDLHAVASSAFTNSVWRLKKVLYVIWLISYTVDFLPSGLSEEGLYRKPGVASKVNNLVKECIEKGKTDKINFSEWDTKTLASAIKYYLGKHLGEPLFTFTMHQQLIDAASEYSEPIQVWLVCSRQPNTIL